jgi:hypothetical protein
MYVENTYGPDGKTLVKSEVRNIFGFQVKAALFGLKTLNGVDITPENVEELVNDLNNNEIGEISDQVADEANFSKKKKS